MNQALKHLAAMLLLLPLAVAAQAPAGKVVMLTGQATAVGADSSVRKLAKEDAVYSGDLINAGNSSYINLRFADGGFFLLKPNTRFQIEDFQHALPDAAQAVDTTPKPVAPPPAAGAPQAPLVALQQSGGSAGSRAFFRLFKGGFRAVSGVIGKANRDDYRVSTPIATIGIRGTKYGADLCGGECVDRDEINTQLRDAGNPSAETETVLVTTVDEGEIEVSTPLATQVQGPGTALFTTDTGTITPATAIPKSIQQDQTLQPEACGN